MSSDQSGKYEAAAPPRSPDSLYHLLKQAQIRLAGLTGAALEPYGVTGRELTVLRVLASQEPASQQQAGQRLGVDRTTMVALLDGLEAKGLVERHPHAGDRRKNVVALTEAGHACMRRAGRAAEAAERAFLAPLPEPGASRFRDALLALIRAGQ